jgi:Zn-dependent protease with chaperone function
MLRDIANAKKMNDVLTEILIFILAILISTFVLRFAWNKSLVKHITVLKPINTFLDAFILSLAIAIVRGV